MEREKTRIENSLKSLKKRKKVLTEKREKMEKEIATIKAQIESLEKAFDRLAK